jgi:hypothetical protein
MGAKKLRVGIICEGGRTDEPLLEVILRALFQGKSVVGLNQPDLMPEQIRKADILIEGLDKETIFTAPAAVIYRMFQRDVDRVLVIWDLLPVGHKMGIASQWNEKPSRREQKQMFLERFLSNTAQPELTLMLNDKIEVLTHAEFLLQHYRQNTVPERIWKSRDHFQVVCVCYTLDGWLLANGQVLRTIAQLEERYDPPHPDECEKPVKELTRYFGRGKNKWFRFFNKIQHNLAIARAYRDADQIETMRASQSFRRVVDTLKVWLDS